MITVLCESEYSTSVVLKVVPNHCSTFFVCLIALFHNFIVIYKRVITRYKNENEYDREQFENPSVIALDVPT